MMAFSKLEIVSMVALHGLIQNPINRGTCLEDARKSVEAARKLLSEANDGVASQPEPAKLNAREAVEYLAKEFALDNPPVRRIYVSAAFPKVEVVVRHIHPNANRGRNPVDPSYQSDRSSRAPAEATLIEACQRVIDGYASLRDAVRDDQVLPEFSKRHVQALIDPEGDGRGVDALEDALVAYKEATDGR